MNTNIKLSDLKEKINTTVLVAIAMVVLVAILGVASYFTIQEVTELKDSIGKNTIAYNENKYLVTSLEKLRTDSEYYAKQQAEYDKVIAANGTYSAVDYYVEIDELCKKYDLQVIDISVGEMMENGNVNQATTVISVVGKEIDVRSMAVEIISQEQIARIDTIAMAKQQDGTVAASLVIVNFTK